MPVLEIKLGQDNIYEVARGRTADPTGTGLSYRGTVCRCTVGVCPTCAALSIMIIIVPMQNRVTHTVMILVTFQPDNLVLAGGEMAPPTSTKIISTIMKGVQDDVIVHPKVSS